MKLGDLSERIARAVSSALNVSVDPGDVEGQIRRKIDEDGIGSFKIDTFLAENYPSLSNQLQFGLQDLPSLQLIAANDVLGYSPNRLLLFEAAVNRALHTALSSDLYGTISAQSYEDISPEFNRAWNAFAKAPIERGIRGILFELGRLGVKPPLLASLNGAWETLYKPRKPGDGVIARYEVLDKSNNMLHVLMPALPDAANVSLAEYRIDELAVAYQNAIQSEVSIVSAHSGFDADGSFGRNLVSGLSKAGFAVNVQNFLEPSVADLKQFSAWSADKDRVIIFTVKGDVSKEHDADALALLRDNFFKGTKKNRIIFLINSKGDTRSSAANSVVPYLKRILNGATRVPSIGINLKKLNERQIGELLYGTSAWDEGSAESVKHVVALIGEQVPMVPATLIELRSIIRGKKSWDQIEAAIIAYGAKLRKPITDDVTKLRLTSVFPSDDSNWYHTRLLNITEKGYGIRLGYRNEAFDTFDVDVAAPIKGPNNSGSGSSGQGGAKLVGDGIGAVVTVPQDSFHAKGWVGFVKLPELQQLGGMQNLLNDDPCGVFNPDRVLMNSSQFAIPSSLQGLVINPFTASKFVPR